jgi:hypothetical protein
MAETIKGGAYQSADGSWHDANGKPLPSSKIQEAEELQKQQAEELARAEAAPEVAQPQTFGRHFVSPQTKTVVTPVEEETAEPKKGRKSKGTD